MKVASFWEKNMEMESLNFQMVQKFQGFGKTIAFKEKLLLNIIMEIDLKEFIINHKKLAKVYINGKLMMEISKFVIEDNLERIILKDMLLQIFKMVKNMKVTSRMGKDRGKVSTTIEMVINLQEYGGKIKNKWESIFLALVKYFRESSKIIKWALEF